MFRQKIMSATLLIACSKSSQVRLEEEKQGGWRASRLSNESRPVIVMAGDNYFRA